MQSPVALAWDAAGGMIAVEMPDYPVGPAGGRVKLLLDRDGDGAVDGHVVLADGLAFPAWRLPWQDWSRSIRA